MRASILALATLGVLLVPSVLGQDSTQSITTRSVQLFIPAVGQTSDGTLFGVASTLIVSMQSPGTGRVFLSVQPLTEIDMQGSARLAVATASQVTGLDASHSDFFFSVHTNSTNIGGPSAGGAMAVAVTSLLEGWSVRRDVVMTGMINPDGSIGPIGGVLQKLEAVDSVGGKTFLVPLGQSVVTEPRTEQVCNNSGTFCQPRTTQESVDVKAYARDHYGITVQQVADLYAAEAPFTGMQLVRPTPTTDPLKDAAYRDITTRLGKNVTVSAATELGNMTLRYNALPADVKNSNDGNVIRQQLSTARDRVTSARDAENQSKEYLASSFGFQALVALEYADSLIAFFESGGSDVAAYASSYGQATDQQLADVGNQINVTYPIPAARLDSQAAAEQRLLEAKNSQADARAAVAARNYGTALQDSSFARQRGESARWWHEIGVEVGAAAQGPTVSRDEVMALIDRYVEIAQLELQYGQLIVNGEPSFTAAQQDQQDAQTALDQDQLGAGLLDLVMVLAHTSTALVAVGGEDPVRQRLPDLQSGAAYQIELTQSQSGAPVYALSLLELGASQASSSPDDAYTSYSIARLVARAGLSALGLPAPQPQIRRAPESAVGGQLAEALRANQVLSVGLAVAVGALLLATVWALAMWSGGRASRGPPSPAPDHAPPSPPMWTMAEKPSPLPTPLVPPPAEPAEPQAPPGPPRKPRAAPRRKPTTTRRRTRRPPPSKDADHE